MDADDPRARAKTINFGIIYGISPFGLARQLGIAQRRGAAPISSAYFERYPGIRDYMERTKRVRRASTGYVATLFGRRCHVPGIARQEPGASAASASAQRSTPRSRARPPTSSSAP